MITIDTTATYEIKEAAELLSTNSYRLRLAWKENNLPMAQVGAKLFVTGENLQKFLTSGTSFAKRPAGNRGLHGAALQRKQEAEARRASDSNGTHSDSKKSSSSKETSSKEAVAA